MSSPALLALLLFRDYTLLNVLQLFGDAVPHAGDETGGKQRWKQ